MWQRLLLALSLGLLAGCGAPWGRKPAAFVPIVEVPFEAESGEPRVEAPAVVEAKDLAAIDLIVHYVQLRDVSLTELPVDVEQPAVVLSAEQAKEVVQKLLSLRGVTMIGSPRLHVLSGQQASFQAITSWQYVAGYTRAEGKPPDAIPTQPVVRKVPEGLTLDVQAAAGEGGVTVTRIEATWTRLLEVPSSRATVRADGKEIVLPFNEPLVLTARTAVATPCLLVVEPGGLVAVPLRDRSVVVRRSSVRDLLRDGTATLRRDKTAQALARADDRGYPLDDDTRILALISARVAAR